MVGALTVQFLHFQTKLDSPRLFDISLSSYSPYQSGPTLLPSSLDSPTYKTANSHRLLMHLTARRALHLQHVVEWVIFRVVRAEVCDSVRGLVLALVSEAAPWGAVGRGTRRGLR